MNNRRVAGFTIVELLIVVVIAILAAVTLVAYSGIRESAEASRVQSVASQTGKLNYRLDAVALGRWGGVWEAPYSNTFVGTTVVENVTNIEKYDTWTIDTMLDDTNAVTNVMPYINSTRLLTTWGNAGSWWGTIATASSGFSPAPYMSSAQPNPGIIWYWV